jgi:hypothetical protein
MNQLYQVIEQNVVVVEDVVVLLRVFVEEVVAEFICQMMR